MSSVAVVVARPDDLLGRRSLGLFGDVWRVSVRSASHGSLKVNIVWYGEKVEPPPQWFALLQAASIHLRLRDSDQPLVYSIERITFDPEFMQIILRPADERTVRRMARLTIDHQLGDKVPEVESLQVITDSSVIILSPF